MMRVLAGVLIAIAVIVLCVLGFIYSGVYNVAATNPHSSLSAWILSETTGNSVRVRSKSLKAPPGFDALNTERIYFVYHSICAACHGGAGAVARGLNPPAPGLAHTARHMTPPAVFWVVKNGIRMTGMPAFGKTYRDEEIWTITAFINRLPPNQPEPEK